MFAAAFAALARVTAMTVALVTLALVTTALAAVLSLSTRT